MNIVVAPTVEAAGELAAELLDEQLRAGEAIGVATGSTPLPVYDALARRQRDGADYARASAWALDEYVGLPAEHPQTYRATLRREFASRIGLLDANLHVPDGAAEDAQRAAADYESAIAARGIAVQLLGVGANGHIGFNEPGSAADSLTRVVDLAERTRRDNARFFEGRLEEVPTRAITQGVATILRARRLVLLAYGVAKADAVAALVEGAIGVHCPASFVREHGDVHMIIDPAAASRLSSTTVRIPEEAAR